MLSISELRVKIGVAFYYKDIEQYPVAWVKNCIKSMQQQTYNRFDVYVLNYGIGYNDDYDFKIGSDIHYFHTPLGNYADAMNFIYSKIFEDCDVAVNTNIDDYYSQDRIEVLMKDLAAGADVASSNSHIVDRNGNITYSTCYHNLDIARELRKGFNPVSNPCHMIKKRVFEKLQFNPVLVPAEDMFYWGQVLEAGFKIVINKSCLHFYRMHDLQSTHRKI